MHTHYPKWEKPLAAIIIINFFVFLSTVHSEDLNLVNLIKNNECQIEKRKDIFIWFNYKNDNDELQVDVFEDFIEETYDTYKIPLSNFSKGDWHRMDLLGGSYKSDNRFSLLIDGQQTWQPDEHIYVPGALNISTKGFVVLSEWNKKDFTNSDQVQILGNVTISLGVALVFSAVINCYTCMKLRNKHNSREDTGVEIKNKTNAEVNLAAAGKLPSPGEENVYEEFDEDLVSAHRDNDVTWRAYHSSEVAPAVPERPSSAHVSENSLYGVVMMQ